MPGAWYICNYVSSATKSRLASRKTGDGLTGTDSGGSLDRTESVAIWSRERPSSLHPPFALLHPGGLIESSSKACSSYDELSFIRQFDSSIIYLYRKWLRLLTTFSTQHFLPLPPSYSSSNLALPRQTQPYGCSSINGVAPGNVFKSLNFAPSRHALFHCCRSHINSSPQCSPW